MDRQRLSKIRVGKTHFTPRTSLAGGIKLAPLIASMPAGMAVFELLQATPEPD